TAPGSRRGPQLAPPRDHPDPSACLGAANRYVTAEAPAHGRPGERTRDSPEGGRDTQANVGQVLTPVAIGPPPSPLLPVARPQPKRPLQWPDLAEGRLHLDRLWRNSGVTTFIPCRLRRHSSRDKKVPPLLSSPCGVHRRSPPACRSPS